MSKKIKSKYQPIIWLIVMVILGILTVKVSKIALLIGVGVLAYGLFKTIIKRNANGEAHLFAGFIVGAEVYFRMSFVGLPWEFAKISVLLLLFFGWLIEKKYKPIPFLFLLYLVILLPGVFIPDWSSIGDFKKEFMFTFFGEVVLVMSVIYFYKRKMDERTLLKMIYWTLLGVIMTSVLLFLKTPDYSTIHYGGGSNFAASGGFGPNQVTAILGLGMTLLGYTLMIGKKIFVYRWIDLVLLLIFTLQGLFTLSRGGLMAAVLSLSFAIIVVYLYNAKQAARILQINFTRIIILGLLLGFSFYFANQVSGGAVEKRYTNIDEYGQQIKADYTTKRGDIVKEDWYTFLEYPLTGAGIGGGRILREEATGISAAHVELSRLPAEHGILGLFALMIMLFFPVWMFFKAKNTLTRFTLVVFTGYAVLTMTHNAMRLALPSFFYAVGFIWVVLDMQKSVVMKRKQ